MASETADIYTDNMLVAPFSGRSPEYMRGAINAFFTRASNERNESVFPPEDRLAIARGAFLAQDTEALDLNHNTEKHEILLELLRDLEENFNLQNLILTSEESLMLSWERNKKIKQSGTLVWLIVCCSLGAATQGMNETAANSAQLYFKYAFGIHENSSLQSFVHAAPYLCCAGSCLMTHWLNNRLGRRWTVFLTCAISCGSCVWQAFPNDWRHMFAARFVLGLGIGPKSATIPIWAAESAPSNVRGSLTMFWQTFTAFGIMLGYIAGVILQPVMVGDNRDICITTPNGKQNQALLLSMKCSLNWRLTIASPMIPPLIAMMIITWLPESPRYLLQEARRKQDPIYYKKAFNSLQRLRNCPLQAGRDLFLMEYLLETELRNRRNLWIRLTELFTKGRNYRAFRASLICLFLQQFCGVNVHVYYSSTIFKSASFSNTGSTLASMGFGIINFIGAFPAFFMIDHQRFGRRNLLLLTFPLMALFQLLTALAFLLPHGPRGALLMVGMYLFSAAYSPGEGPVPFVYAAESMPLYIRDLGMSIVTAVNWFFNWLLAVTFLPFKDRLGNTGVLAYYAGWCAVGWFLVFLFVPETRGLSLEELDEVFKVPTREYVQYAFQQLKYFIMRYILGSYRVAPDPLRRREMGRLTPPPMDK